ncbi:hypothetical protein BAUCODRAFT_479652 [Baudoinia panamericana UAMH 10762]|uniref:Uncharacterized protein n=1 Tax=Baudoinia panamericana (strain UAMH 10762) TaxID=717646 RepID=M2LQ64_BAUPA|nr:uncharacterized protein BAUCODRAFT_479652 [Baudoinia panamericana UAMH 10762]EMC96537.1 hypothetical protein BAUCODRAFT_479652 [Baudoinia panamericana UAMH 10762]
MVAEAREGVLPAEPEALDLDRDLVKRGRSTEFPWLLGGVDAPWVKAPDLPPETVSPAALTLDIRKMTVQAHISIDQPACALFTTNTCIGEMMDEERKQGEEAEQKKKEKEKDFDDNASITSNKYSLPLLDRKFFQTNW